MKVAIMQPYTFPYIGYFNLINSADHFVFMDDVKFKKKGWINRNRIALEGKPHQFTIPLLKTSQNRYIKDIKTYKPNYFLNKLIIKFDHAYNKAPYFINAKKEIKTALFTDSNLISTIAINSIKTVCKYVGLKKKFHRSSIISPETIKLSPAERIIAITKSLGCNKYNNLPGGKL